MEIDGKASKESGDQVTARKLRMRNKMRCGRMSYDRKVEVIKHLREGAGVSEIARAVGTTSDTVAEILHSQDEILKRYKEIQLDKDKSVNYSERTVVRFERNRMKIDQAMNGWFGLQCNYNLKVTKPRLIRKFKYIRSRLTSGYNTNFQTWYSRWKEEQCVETKPAWLKKHCMGYVETFSRAHSLNVAELFDPRDVFSVGEFVVETSLLPGHAVSDPLVVLMGCNLLGHEKCPLFVIGNEPNPNATNLPCGYVENEDSLMESDHFVHWLLQFDKRLKSKSRMIVLLMHDSPIHPLDVVKDLTNIKIQFVAEENGIPINRGISRALKLKYLELILQKIKLSPESSFTLIDTLHLLSRAWWHIQYDVISDSFKRAGFHSSKDSQVVKAETTHNYTRKLKEFLDGKAKCHGISSSGEICSNILEYGDLSVFERCVSDPDRAVHVDKTNLDQEAMTSLHYLGKFLKKDEHFGASGDENKNNSKISLFSVVEKNVKKRIGENALEDDEVVVKQMNMSLAGNWPLICI